MNKNSVMRKNISIDENLYQFGDFFTAKQVKAASAISNVKKFGKYLEESRLGHHFRNSRFYNHTIIYTLMPGSHNPTL